MYTPPTTTPALYYLPDRFARKRRPRNLDSRLLPSYITHILDLDGFLLQNGFVCKELALIEIATNRLFSEQFILGRSFDQLTDLDKTTAKYLTKHIHGIPFVDSPNDRLFQNYVPCVLHHFLSAGPYLLQNVVVGYKGGKLELMLLDYLKIRSINLEELGCPKFNELMTSPSYNILQFSAFYDMQQIACSLHTVPIRSVNPFHCSRHEVCMFRHWYIMFGINVVYGIRRDFFARQRNLLLYEGTRV